MVYLEFVEERANGDVVYDYAPESLAAQRGTVSVNRNTRERKKLKGSEDGDWWPAYHGQAWKRIDQMIDAGRLEEKAYVAWY